MNTNIDIQTLVSKIPEQELFLKSCSHAWDKIAAIAPSDSSVRLFVNKEAGLFVVGVALASQELMFTLEKTATSPFMALEETLKESLIRISKWSTSRSTEAS